ncbi:P-loop containing nucleoside triphosphate hydrolase protein [Lactarius psammicola]|nr:P-loop containing nucleoside triphosphate hydrolase protein [Lactarius psammicola]
MSRFSSGVHRELLAGLKIFNTASLTSEEEIATAVAVLEGTLGDRSMVPIIHCSLQPEHPYAFEFIISSVQDVTSTYILRFILNEFSSDVGAFRASLGYKIVSRLSLSLSQLPYPSNGRPEGLDDRCRHTQIAPTIIEDLSLLLQSGFFEEIEFEGRSNRKTTQRPKSSRRKATTGMHAETNDRLFQALGSRVPRTRESAEEIIQSTIDNQKDTLRFFFTLLQRLEITELVRNAYFRGNIPQGMRVDAAPPPETGETHPSSTAGGDPLQADLYFPPVTGFGEWRILCSHAFLGDLTRDSALSKAVLGRLRELSLGCFSETNQKRLTRDSPIDIFRARLPGGTRLVYLIDVVPEFGRDYEIQVLRILGIYSMDKLNRTDWESAGRYRAKKGREYIGKCKARGPCGGFYYDPMTFCATTTQAGTIPTDSSIPDQEVEEVDEIHRLFDLEQYSMLSQDVMRDILEGHKYPHIFQVSWEEKEVIEFAKSSFVLGRSGTGKTTVIVFKIFGIERAWQNRGSVGPRPRQLFITKSRLLADKVENDYVNLLFSLSADPDTPQYVRDRIQHWESRRKNGVLDPDEAEGMRDDLPDKFSELQDSHFPLFITVDTLWSLLEADVKPPPSKIRHSRSQQRSNKWLGHTDLVTFDVFKRMYWRHLPQTLTKGIVPSVAFSDIIGTIKGSEKSLEFPNRALDSGSYESLTSRNYTLFEAYEKLKRERRERDLADRTHDLLDGIKENGLKGELVDFVYVDEVQDLLLIDARLIVSLCRNPDGFLWAGDTAQTISIGSTFSFKELGAFVYRYQKSIRAVRGTPSHPKGFRLLVNYRSHGGIVKCANAIIQLLQRFPGAIDDLQPEAGVAGKAMPVFFHSECLPSQERDFFLLSTGRPCMLGSKQCIIVRDEAARQKLKSDIGPVGIILTLFNSKGLEYDDVILYNFFGESANANLWRHLTDAQLHPIADLKHAPLIHELKCLYVAITRARHRLWIVDYSGVCLPIKWHLLNLGLVEEPPTAQNPLEAFADRSTSKEWSEAGKRLLNHGEFEEAIMAFKNAEDVYMTAVAVACRRREVARDIPESLTKRRREAFISAAGAFEHCGSMAANDEEERSRYIAAARCYAEIKYHQEVVRTLKRAEMYTEAASYCFDNNLLNDAVSLIKTLKVDQETTERIKQVARVSYLEAKNLKKAEELFDDEDEQMEFVVEHELGAALAVILESKRNTEKRSNSTCRKAKSWMLLR